MLVLERRPKYSALMQYLSPLIAVVLTLIVGMIMAILAELDFILAFKAFFIFPVSDMYGIGELLLKASPLMLIAVGLAIGFRSNVWNIGAEGQFIFGAITGGSVALFFYEKDGFYIMPMVLIAGVFGGMLWAAIPALLRTRFNTNEILVSLMLNYVALLILSYLVHGPLRSPEGFNFPETRQFTESATLSIIIEGTRIHSAVLLSFIFIVISWVFIKKSFMGYKMQTAGLAGKAADYAGFSRNIMIWSAFLIGGGVAGLAGAAEVAGPIGQLLPIVSPGYGYAAIIVAFVGRLHPFGILLASLLMSLLYLGGESAQIELGLPAAVTGVFQGMLLFFLLASDVFVNFRIRFTKPRLQHKSKQQEPGNELKTQEMNI